MAVVDGAPATPKVARSSAAEAKQLSNRAIRAWLDEAPTQAPWSVHGRPPPTQGSQYGQRTQLQTLEHEMKLDLDHLRKERGFNYRA
ncbi:hypothetical protein MMC26_004461 [Xylographa opegraphella]|nr:hypothetical protein [Xylographa opegraphella]